MPLAPVLAVSEPNGEVSCVVGDDEFCGNAKGFAA